MSQCPFANLLDPDTYAEGMPYDKLREIREAGPVVKIDDPITGIPYWAVTRVEDMDYVSKNPKLFSSEERSAFPETSSIDDAIDTMDTLAALISLV